MMAFAGKIAVLIGLAAVVFGGNELRQALGGAQEPRDAPVAAETPALNPPVTTAETGARPWPAVFGVLNEAAPPPDEPTTVNEDYQLIGLIAGQEIRWAIVSFSGGEALVRVGDVLAGGEVVEDITTEGVWTRQGQKRSRIGFSSEDVAAMAEPAMPAAGASKLDQSVEITRSTFTGKDLRRVFGRAGTIQLTPGKSREAGLVPQILWVRPNEIFDRIGLMAGDKVLRINGKPAGDPDTLRQSGGLLASEKQIRLDILRSGVTGTITVILVENG